MRPGTKVKLVKLDERGPMGSLSRPLKIGMEGVVIAFRPSDKHALIKFKGVGGHIAYGPECIQQI